MEDLVASNCWKTYCKTLLMLIPVFFFFFLLMSHLISHLCSTSWDVRVKSQRSRSTFWAVVDTRWRNVAVSSLIGPALYGNASAIVLCYVIYKQKKYIVTLFSPPSLSCQQMPLNVAL